MTKQFRNKQTNKKTNNILKKQLDPQAGSMSSDPLSNKQHYAQILFSFFSLENVFFPKGWQKNPPK